MDDIDINIAYINFNEKAKQQFQNQKRSKIENLKKQHKNSHKETNSF